MSSSSSATTILATGFSLERPANSSAVGSVLEPPVGGGGHGLLDLHQELAVALGLLEALEEKLQRLLPVEPGEHPTQFPDDRDLLLAHQQLFTASAGGDHVYRREDALVRELAAQPQLHVSGALELLEDDLVHLGPGFDERGGQDGQRSAVLDVAGGTEEPLRRVQRRGVHASGQDAPTSRRRDVVGTAQTGDRVEQHHDVVTEPTRRT